MDEQKKEYAGELMNIIMKVPVGTSYLLATAKCYDENGKPVSYEMKMDSGMLAEARKDFLDNVEDGDEYDMIYTLTEEGRQFLEQLEAERCSDEMS